MNRQLITAQLNSAFGFCGEAEYVFSQKKVDDQCSSTFSILTYFFGKALADQPSIFNIAKSHRIDIGP